MSAITSDPGDLGRNTRINLDWAGTFVRHKVVIADDND